MGNVNENCCQENNIYAILADYSEWLAGVNAHGRGFAVVAGEVRSRVSVFRLKG